MATPVLFRPSFLEVLPTRVRRGYTGGAGLERWTGDGPGQDSNQPEDWIASTTLAQNPGLPPREGEGLTRVRPPGGTASDLRAELARDPEYFLGAAHVRAKGAEIGFLAKILDASIRLHIQAHPTAAFSQQHLASRYGKLESYVILGARAGSEPYALLGFRHAPSRAEWRRIIAEQDVTAMHACLNRVPLRAGEVWLVPGGLPHAIGEGVLMLEVMEPSDWVVRCEFERAGLIVPPAGRFMGRDLDFCLNLFDYQSYDDAAIRGKCRLEPRVLAESSAATEEELVGPAQTGCFRVHRLRVRATAPVPAPGNFRLLLVTSGHGQLLAPHDAHALRPGARVLLPAGSGDCRIQPGPGNPLEAVLCLPG
ncbi:MAG TPA: phosphoheptose isomerase [Lacunisphaera sp.]|nr:phosphoheptose isomerase [Lacunisphaera sp.]